MLPCKTFRIAIGLGDDGDEDEALQFGFQAFIHIVGFEKAVVGVGVKVNGDRFFDCGGQFLLQSIYKLRHPARTVIDVAVADEDVIFVAWNYACHTINLIFSNLFTSLTKSMTKLF